MSPVRNGLLAGVWPAMLLLLLSAGSNGGNDHLVTMMLATFGVAGAAVVIGLLAYLLRVRLGLVTAPPPPGEGHDTH
jgi:hypothetical protein